MVNEYDGEILSFSTGSYLKVPQGGNLFNTLNLFGYKTGIASSSLTINKYSAINETLIPAELLNINIEASAAKITNSSVLNFNNLFSYKENQFLNEIILNIESAEHIILNNGYDIGDSNNYTDLILRSTKDDDYIAFYYENINITYGNTDSYPQCLELKSININYSDIDPYPQCLELNSINISYGNSDSYPQCLDYYAYVLSGDKDSKIANNKHFNNIHSTKDPLHSLDVDPNKYPDKDAPMNDNKETYVMRALDLNANGKVYRVWSVKETPDWTGELYFGEFSGPTKNFGEIKIISVLKE